MAFDTENRLLQGYQVALNALTANASADQWKQAMEPLVQRTVALLKRRCSEAETFTAQDLLERFASEHIEVFAEMTVAMVHPNVAQGVEYDEPLLDHSMTTLHFPSNDDADAIQLEDNLSLLEVAAKFGIAPDLRVWEVNEDID